MPDVTTLVGDDMANRAFVAALFGFLFFPLFFFSGWTLLKLMAYPGSLSPVGIRKLYAALVIDALGAVLILSVLARFGAFD